MKSTDRIKAMAKILGCTQGQIKAQLDRNSRQLREMEAESKKRGGTYRGFTTSDLTALALSYEQRSI